MRIPPSTTIHFCFRHSVADLAEEDFTVIVLKNGVDSAISVSISETDSPGLYTGSFTLDDDEDAFYTVEVYRTAHLTQGTWKGDWFAKSDPSGTSAGEVANAVLDELVSEHVGEGSLGSLIKAIKAWVCNRLLVTGQDYVVYDDDNETELFTGTITASERLPDEDGG